MHAKVRGMGGGTGTPLGRISTPADSILDASTPAMAPAGTEAPHTPLTLPAGILNVARREIVWRAYFRALADIGADTWLSRVRLGAAGVGGVDLTGGLVIASDLVANTEIWVEGVVQIRTVGVGGTFDSRIAYWNAATGLF